MPDIDFHILPDANPTRRLEYACRLAAKAWRHGFGVLLHCPDAASAERMDQLLWQRPAASFIPHELAGSTCAPVLIAWPQAPGLSPAMTAAYPVLINLASSIPAWYEGHQRIIEVVNQDAQVREALRQSFTQYRQRGYSPRHTTVNPEQQQ